MKNRTRNNRNHGFTLVETLTAVAIIVILLGISAVSVVRYIDLLKITELDNAARDIYMAAENRAVLLSGAQRLDSVLKNADDSVGVLTELEGRAALADHSDEENYYVTKAKAGEDLLITGNIDPTLLDGDFYIVYDLVSGSVTDVFYAENKEALGKLITDNKKDDDEFADFYAIWADARSERLSLKNGKSTSHDNVKNPDKTLVGWYNGKASEGVTLKTDITQQPFIDVMIVNREELTVTVTVRWDRLETDAAKAAVVDAIKGDGLTVILGDGEFDLIANSEEEDGICKGRLIDGSTVRPEEITGTSYTCTWVLDSLTRGQFVELKEASEGTATPIDIAPGEDFKVTATIKPINVDPGEPAPFMEASVEDENNSLFAEGSGNGTAYIACLRHLQNLDAGNGHNSGVKEYGTEINAVVQTGDIFGYGNEYTDGTRTRIYNEYNFVPIYNIDIVSYEATEKGTGKYYEIRGLWADVAHNDKITDAAKNYAGLFRETDGVTFENIRMVNTTVIGSSNVGALAGEATNAEIKNCWVYWENDAVNGVNLKTKLGNSTTEYNYQLVGNQVGGLVGIASNGITIEESLAATLIQGRIVGGLVGHVSSGTATIEHSYADCYLNASGTDNVSAAGLVGNVNGSVTLADCYAAGFIVDAGTANAAGLCFGDTTVETGSHAYSVLLSLDSASNAVSRLTSLTGNATDPENAYLLGTYFGDMTGPDFLAELGRPFVSKLPAAPGDGGDGDDEPDPEPAPAPEPDDAKDSYPYNLRGNLDDYIYPGLEGMPHYGDWDEVNDITPIGPVYFEEYANYVQGTSAGWGFNGKDFYDDNPTVKAENLPRLSGDENVVKYDGYAMAFWSESGDTDGLSFEYAYNGTVSGSEEGITSEKIRVKLDNDTEGFVILFPLPLQTENGLGNDFYASLTITLNKGRADEASRYYYFNPHFANTATMVTMEKLAEGKDFTNTDAPTTVTIPGASAAAPFEIRSARQLYNLSYKYNNIAGLTAYYGKTYHQTMHIDYNKYRENVLFQGDHTNTDWSNHQPIGTSEANAFTGTYDGSYAVGGETLSHTITGLRVRGGSGASNQGLFGFVGGTGLDTVKGTVQYVTLVNCVVDGQHNVGGIVGVNFGLVDHCSNTGTSATVTGANSAIGGIVGKNGNLLNVHQPGGTVTNCVNEANILGTKDDRNNSDSRERGSNEVGGIVGWNCYYGTVANCQNIGGTVKSEHGKDVGGIVGKNGNEVGGNSGAEAGGAVTNCVNEAAVTGGLGQNNVGGIVGGNYAKNEKDAAKVTGCTNNGTVSGTGNSYNVGGIVGLNDGGTVGGENEGDSCTNNGAVSGNTEVGGIAGRNGREWEYEDIGTVTGCTNSGKVTGFVERIGGVVGQNNGKVENCHNTGEGAKVESPNASNVGGIVGHNSDAGLGLVKGCYTDESASVIAMYNVGGIVGLNHKTVEDCHTGTGATVEGTSGGEAVGGIVGRNGELSDEGDDKYCVYSTVTDCTNGASVIGAAKINVGGIVGYNDVDSFVTICTNEGPVGSESSTNVGGIVGHNNGGTVGGSEDEACTNNGAVKGNTEVGGVVGLNKVGGVVGISNRVIGGTVTYCTNSTDDNDPVTGVTNVGGIIGLNSSTVAVANCNNSGTVSGSDSSNYVGGIVGQNNGGTVGGSTDEACTNTGAVSGAWNIGGIVGWNNSGTVKYCNNSSTDDNPVTGSGGNVGGIIGLNESTNAVTNCNNSGTVGSGIERVVGGIVGYNGRRSTVGGVSEEYACTNTGKVTALVLVGGIVGAQDAATVQYCYNRASGQVISTGTTTEELGTVGSFAGGIVGRNGHGDNGGNGGKVDHCDSETGTTVTGVDYVGGIVGWNQTALSNCQSAANVTGNDYIGGIVGYYYDGGSMTNCTSAGPVGDTNSKHVGGLVGRNGIELSPNGNSVTDTASVTGNEYVGGIVGWNDDDDDGGTVTGFTLTTQIPLTGNKYIGGVVGENTGNVWSCVNQITVNPTHTSGGNTEGVGGIVGRNNGSVGFDPKNANAPLPCENQGSVSGGTMVGGIVGENAGGTVKFSKNTTTNGYTDGIKEDNTGNIISVTGSGNNVGGIVGHNTSGMVSDCYNAGLVYSKSDNVGGIVGYNHYEGSTVTNCHNIGTVTGGAIVGGISGQSDGKTTVSGCYNGIAIIDGEVKQGGGTVTSTRDTVGGIVGWCRDSEVSDCYNVGTVGSDSNSIGGIVGHCDYASRVLRCYNGVADIGGTTRFTTGVTVTGTGTGDSSYNVGGIVGNNQAGTEVSGCYNVGTVTGTSEESNNVGGIVGHSWDAYNNVDAKVLGCYNGIAIIDGRVVTNPDGTTVSGGNTVGGVVGLNNQRSDVSECYNIGPVNSKGNDVGGIVGHNWGDGSTVTDCYNTGSVDGGKDNVGGIVGENNDSGAVSRCYNGAANINGTQYTGGTVEGDGNNVGGIVGYSHNNGAVSDCHNIGSVTGHGERTGGIAGYNYVNCEVSGCYNAGMVTGYKNSVGGIVGWNYDNSEVSDCHNGVATIDGTQYDGGMVLGSGENSQYVGGIVGQNVHHSEVLNCTSYDDSEVSGYMYVGGIAGVNNGSGGISVVSGCSNDSKVSGHMYIGGIAGVNDNGADVTGCYNTADVTGTGGGTGKGNIDFGGVVGWNNANSTVNYCYNTGSVEGNQNVGGAVGENLGPVEQCYSIGKVQGNSNVGGVAGNNSSTVTSCYYLENTVNGVNGGINGVDYEGSAEPLTKDQFGDREKFVNWQFTDLEDWEDRTYTGTDTESPWVMCVDIRSTAYPGYQAKPEDGFKDEFPDYRPGLKDNLEKWLLPWEDPYKDYFKIHCGATLNEFKQMVENGNSDAKGVVTQDFDIKETCPIHGAGITGYWTPINGNYWSSNGVLDGDNFTIRGLDVKTNDNAGLFSEVGWINGGGEGGTIRNLNVKGDVLGANYVGGIAGQFHGGKIENCSFSGTVSGTGAGVGGIVGNTSSTVQNCYNEGTVDGATWVGGIAGQITGNGVQNCYNIGTVNGTSTVGGIVGQGGALQNCYNTGSVTGSSFAGGIMGLGTGATNCYYLNNIADNGYGTSVTADELNPSNPGGNVDVLTELNKGNTESSPWGKKDGIEHPVLIGVGEEGKDATPADVITAAAPADVGRAVTAALPPAGPEIPAPEVPESEAEPEDPEDPADPEDKDAKLKLIKAQATLIRLVLNWMTMIFR